MPLRRPPVLFCLLLLLAGCAAQAPLLTAHLSKSAAPVVLDETPFFAQQRYQCGPAALAMSLQASGVSVQPAALVPKVWIPALKGSLQAEIIAATRDYRRVPYVIAPRLDALLAELRAHHPVLVLLNLGWRFYPIWHYAVVIGYLPNADAMLLHSGTDKRKRVDTRDFLDNWNKAERWGVAVLRPDELPAGNDPRRYLRAVAPLEQKGDPRAAERAYAAALTRWPDAVAARLGLGNSRYAQGNLSGAEQAWRGVLRRHPDVVIARNNLAQVLAEQGCVAQAREQIDAALANAPLTLRARLRQTRDQINAMQASGSDCQ